MVYRASTLRGLAIAQMVFGAIMIVFGVACIFSAEYWSSYVAFGVWVGLWVLITGILGYIGARDDSIPNKCLIGCFMGFSITACVLSGVMFICYCVTLAQYSEMKAYCENQYRGSHDYNSGFTRYYDCYRTYHFKRKTAVNVAGLGSCLLIFSLVEFFLALASSIYCCTAVCCGTSPGVVSSIRTNQQVMYVQPQYMYPGAQPGMVFMQTDAGVVPQGYPATVQQPVYFAQQPGLVAQPGVVAQSGAVTQPGVAAQPGVAFQQPTYWAVPSGSNPAGAVTVPYSDSAVQVQNQAQVQIPAAVKDEDMPPPYSFAQTANVPPQAFSSMGASPNN